MNGQKMGMAPQMQNNLFQQSQLDPYEGESQVMAGLVATVTHNNHPRGPVYADDDRILQNYDYESAYARKPQAIYTYISQEPEFSLDDTSDYSASQSAIDDLCNSLPEDSVTQSMQTRRVTPTPPNKRNKKSSTYSRWTSEEDNLLRQAVMLYGPHKWSMIASHVPNRTPMQCSTRWLGALNPNIHKGRWTQHEDAVLRYAVQEFSNIPDGEDGTQPIPWNKIAQRIPNRTGIQCQARWTEALDPTVRKGKWSEPEDSLLRAGVEAFGKCWIRIAESIPGRTQRQCRTRWVQLKYKEEKQSAKSNCTKAKPKTSSTQGSSLSLQSLQMSSMPSNLDYVDDSMNSSLPLSSSSSTVSWDGESATPFDDGSSDVVQVAQNNFFIPDSKQFHSVMQPFSDVKYEAPRMFIPGFGLSTNDGWSR
ncbi:hypothetical protein NQZ79_g5285 [Umbelopsis isabellina]|nr:hypothetical protein NQZ79_g5285 [Umbelopsis isabellina]